MVTISCPECQSQIQINSDTEIGQRVICQSCNVILEVTWLFPIEVDFTEDVEQNSLCMGGSQK